MSDYKVPGLLTPEVIDTLSKNAEALRGMMNSGEEIAILNSPCGHGGDEDCCSPKIVKIKNILCYVWIKNKNAVAEKEKHHHRD